MIGLLCDSIETIGLSSCYYKFSPARVVVVVLSYVNLRVSFLSIRQSEGTVGSHITFHGLWNFLMKIQN